MLCRIVSKYFDKSTSITFHILLSILRLTADNARCGDRFGLYPYELLQKLASNIGSKITFKAPCTTRSRIQGICSFLVLPLLFGISTARFNLGLYVLVSSSSRISSRNFLTPYSS